MSVAPAWNQTEEGASPSAALINVGAEQALLGILLYQNDVFESVSDVVKPEHMAEPLHERLYACGLQLFRAGKLFDQITLEARFAADPALVEFGGLRYLADLVDHAPPSVNASAYAAEIVDLALRRGVIAVCRDVEAQAQSIGETEAATVIQDAARSLSELEVSVGGNHWVSGGGAVRAAIERAQSRTGQIDFPFGTPSVDAFTGGMNAGEVTIIAARPGMGKSVAALNIAKANAAVGRGTCIFSLEMTREALGMRLACDVAYDRSAPYYNGVPVCPSFDKAMKGELDEQQWRRLMEAQEIIDGWPLMIDDRSGLTMAQIEAAVRRQHRQWRRMGILPGPTIIDHLGKVKPPVDRKGSKHAEVADVSHEGQVMAKRLKAPVLELVQLNRGVETRDDKRPILSDLRQAGELEEDARQVVFLFRPEYYCREGKPDESFEERTERLEQLDACRNQMLWLIEKNSHGPRGQVQTFCEIACSAIREW